MRRKFILNLCHYREIISREFGDTIQVYFEYLEAYPEESDQIEQIWLEEATYKRNYYKVDGIMTATGTNQKMFNDELFTEEFFTTRWWNVLQTDRQALLDFIQSNPKEGDIFKRKMFPPSPTMILQTLKNICTSDLIYEFGKSYVGMGYVDLTPLLWAEFQNKECRKPMNFYGYNNSVVVVLRSKVILELLKMDEAKIFTSSILQVLPCFFISFSIKTTFSFYKLLKTAKKKSTKFRNEFESSHKSMVSCCRHFSSFNRVKEYIGMGKKSFLNKCFNL